MFSYRPAVAVSALAALLVPHGSSLADQSEEPSGSGAGDALATAAPTEHDDSLQLEVTSLERSASGGFTALTYSITNTGDEEVEYPAIELQSGVFTYTESPLAMSGVSLSTDETRFFPNSNSEDICLCATDSASEAPSSLEPGDSQATWATFWLPDNVDEVTVEVWGFEAAENVQVTKN